MHKKLAALLFDTRSIQRYIYSGNRLVTNIGASYIVERVFQDILIDEVLKPMFKFKNTDDNVWNIDNDDKTTWQNGCCVAYVGGGNALILFNEDRHFEVVSEFTRKLLIKRPGLKVGVAYGELEIIDDKLNQKNIDDLYAQLKNNQNRVFPAVNVPYTGLTLSCEINGEAANFCDMNGLLGKDIRFYSQETAVKAKIATKTANQNLKDRFNKIFERKNVDLNMNNYEFPLSIEELGQMETENYIAVIHVDGNNMGLKFRTCTSLDERRKLSREIKRKVESAFADLLIKIIKMDFGDNLKLTGNNLPIRPLIIGGDDVTFICPANVAIMFTKTLMELMSATTPENAPEHLTQKISRHIDCCAGIAILPAAYPFFRGYKLAEQLCDSAKKSMRELLPKDLNDKETLTAEDIPEGSNWLDFAILHGEQAPTLEQIRATEYSGERSDNLHFGPYRVANSISKHKIDNRHDIENLLECTTKFKNSEMANNKIKEMRQILQRDKSDTYKFLHQLELQGKHLPEIDAWKDFIVEGDLFSKNNETPYVDAIELMDFYLPEVAEQWQKL